MPLRQIGDAFPDKPQRLPRFAQHVKAFRLGTPQRAQFGAKRTALKHVLYLPHLLKCLTKLPAPDFNLGELVLNRLAGSETLIFGKNSIEALLGLIPLF